MALTYAQRRELDTLIHRHVLDWEKFRDQPELHDGRLHTALWRRRRPDTTPTEWWVWEFCDEPLHYSVDVVLAFDVVQAMNAKGWGVEMRCLHSVDSERRQVWQVDFTGQNNQSGYSTDLQLPLAICNAALRAIAVHPECLITQKEYSAP
ncbi:MAG: hypothetical protein NT169_07800 [Chloroflexi bacterium]|nr:hypothetical protein [Chloroflexota bacterium]